MASKRHRMVILWVGMAVILGTLACSAGSLISREEPATATPTKTPKPTFTATLTPTETPVPTDTPLPTDTPAPTDTPEPTQTPVIVTETPSPAPTDTATPTFTPVPPTKTPKPTKRPPTKTPTPRPPTATPAPQFAWSGLVDNTLQNCGLTRLFGFTLDRAGGLAGDVWLHYWATGWDGAWAISGWVDFGAGTPWAGDEGNWDATLDNHAKDGVWNVCIVPSQGSWECQSNTISATTSADCVNGIQVVHITFRKN